MTDKRIAHWPPTSILTARHAKVTALVSSAAAAAIARDAANGGQRLRGRKREAKGEKEEREGSELCPIGNRKPGFAPGAACSIIGGSIMVAVGCGVAAWCSG